MLPSPKSSPAAVQLFGVSGCVTLSITLLHMAPLSASRRRYSARAPVQTFVRVRIIKLEELLMNKLVARFVKDESGVTAIEYGLIAAGISVAIIAVVQGLGTNLKNTFQSVSTALK
jgi:pilus assembly protein Flp/PilA